MAKSIKIVFTEIIFNKQKDCISYVRELLLHLEPTGFVDDSSPHWPFFSELLARHPDYEEKRGSGIKKFLISRSAYKHIELNLERIDGSKSDVSWIKCVTGRPISILGNLKAAMRVEIDSQIESFKTKYYDPSLTCQICNLALTNPNDVHVDHIIHFDTLVENFLATQQNHPNDFDDELVTNRAKFKKVDSLFADKWNTYHGQSSKLRLVHADCNLRRKKAI